MLDDSIINPRRIQWPQMYENQLAIVINNNRQLGRTPTTLPNAPKIAVPTVGTATGFQFSFTQLTVPTGQNNVIAAYRVYRNTQNVFISAQLVHTFVHDPTHKGPITFTDTIQAASGASYFYWVTSVDTSGQESLPNSAQSAAATGSAGSTPFSIAGNFTYTSTTTSITWAWSGVQILRSDNTTTAVPDGNQATTGLSPSNTYVFYPYWDEASKSVQWVAGGSGSPAYAQAAASISLFRSQNLRNRVALSNGGMSASTPAAGTGSGSGSKGGGGGGHSTF